MCLHYIQIIILYANISCIFTYSRMRHVINILSSNSSVKYIQNMFTNISPNRKILSNTLMTHLVPSLRSKTQHADIIMTLIQMNNSPFITPVQCEWQTDLSYDWAVQTVIMKLLEQAFDSSGPEGSWKHIDQDLPNPPKFH